MKLIHNITFFSLIVLSSLVTAQTGSIEEVVYSDKIKTVLLSPASSELSLPIINLNSKEKLLLRFDELQAQPTSYRYKIQHCNANWELSELRTNQYIDGFEDYPISNQAYSFNTLQRYVNYHEVIPNDRSTLKVSGNYIITVYAEGNENKPIFTKQFRVREEGVAIKGEIKISSNVEFRDKQQEAILSINPTAYPFLNNPDENVKVYIQQNNRKDQTRLLKMHSIRGNDYQYIWSPDNFFNGGNEFRNFDIKNIRIRSRYVERLDYIDGENQVYLLPEKDKSRLPYSYEDDINGKYVIHADNSTNSNIEGDYGWVYFLFPVTAPRLDGSFHIVGQLTNWSLDKNNKMTYSDTHRAYLFALYLKQGYYNYQILFKRANSNIGNEAMVEGNHSETENEYTVLVYYRKPGDVYDRLVGVTTINSSARNR